MMSPKKLTTDSFTVYIQCEAKAMAEAINGGSWEEHYTEAQRVGWCQKAVYAARHFGAYRGFC